MLQNRTRRHAYDLAVGITLRLHQRISVHVHGRADLGVTRQLLLDADRRSRCVQP